jgi:NAD-dependent dihydropyrimidine dehydrogenase PreA subunit
MIILNLNHSLPFEKGELERDCKPIKMGVKIDTLKCTGCGACIYVCPVSVLEVIDMKCRMNEGCISCGKCVPVCNWMAITLEKEPDKK